MTSNFYEGETIGYEPQIDFKTPKIIIKNGSPFLINKYNAVIQWITKFCMTEKDVYPIYEGTGFGNRIKQLFGRKRIGYGYEESEIERDFREGLPLCPAISGVTDFKLKKAGKNLNIDISVELTDSEALNITIEKVYTFSF